jgi:cytoskeletal protein RodZ
MEETLNRLRSIGAEEISEKTHISRGKVQDILDKKYENFDKVKIAGFIHIIEREYHVDLHEWLEAFEESHKDDADTQNDDLELRTGFIEKKEKSSGFWKLLLFAIVLVAIGGYLAYKQGFIEFADKKVVQSSSETPRAQDSEGVVEEVDVIEAMPDEDAQKQELIEVEEVAIEESMSPSAEDTMNSEANATKIDDTQKEIAPKEVAEKSLEFKIDPRSRLWIGKIDVDTKRKESLITDDEYTLDVENDTLIITGHGDISVSVDGNVTEYRELDPIRFHLTKDGAKLITFEEFKRLNGGNSW